MSEKTAQPISGPTVGQQAHESVAQAQGQLWRVIIHNDEVTPYEYVMHTLNDLFMVSEEIADHIAWTAHTKGQALVVVRPRSEAEKLVKVAHGRAKVDGFPLAFSLELN